MCYKHALNTTYHIILHWTVFYENAWLDCISQVNYILAIIVNTLVFFIRSRMESNPIEQCNNGFHKNSSVNLKQYTFQLLSQQFELLSNS